MPGAKLLEWSCSWLWGKVGCWNKLANH
jgi:hypothetical protein